jgi:HAE1 family hydrophobic/amphiphilic exporter-1
VPTIRDSLARFDGKYTYTGMVRMAAGANPVMASQRYSQACTELESDPQLAGISFRHQFDQGASSARASTGSCWRASRAGLAALLVLWLFIRSVRLVLVIAVSIPLSMLASAPGCSSPAAR